MSANRVPQLVLSFLYAIFFLSLAFTFRAISSISIGLLIIATLVFHRQLNRPFSPSFFLHPFFLGCLVLFISLAASVLVHRLPFSQLERHAGLVLAPLAWAGSHSLDKSARRKIALFFILATAASALVCLAAALIRFLQTGEGNPFFYHQLVSPLDGHAVYQSATVVMAIWLLQEKEMAAALSNTSRLWLRWLLIVFLLLLASKLFIAALAAYFLLALFSVVGKRKKLKQREWGIGLIIAVALTLFLVLAKPIRERFADLRQTDLQVLSQARFDPGMYFNSVQFRLLQWRLTPELLSANHAWWTGVGPGRAQDLLDEKYRSLQMYRGDPVLGLQGYPGYNTHNQFLESLLQAGIPGLLSLLLACFGLIRSAIRRRNRAFSSLVVVSLAWFFTESVLQRQYGILLFTLLPLYHWFDEN